MDNKSTNTATMEQRLEKELKASLVDGRLPCTAAFKISQKLKVSLKKVSDIANKLNVKIANCQLGCFP